MMKKCNPDSGSALIWSLMLLLVAAALLACVLPLASSSITSSNQSNYSQQAYYTAKSVVDMLVEYVTSDAEQRTGVSESSQPVGYQILKKAMDAGETGYIYNVNGLDNMGSCIAKVSYKDSTLYIKATASYGNQNSTLTASLKQSTGNDSFIASTAYISGIYPGIRSNSIQGSEGSNCVIKMINGNIILIAQKDTTQKKEDRPVSNVLIQNVPGQSKEKSPHLYTKQDIVNHAVITENDDCKLRTVYASQSELGTTEDPDIVLDNQNNLFDVNSNVFAQNTSNGYVYYTSQLLKLAGQIEISNTDMVNTNKYFTVGRIILDGNDVDKTKNIGYELSDHSGNGGIDVSEYKMYIDNGAYFNHTHYKASSNGGISCDGPVFLRNTNGQTLIELDKDKRTKILVGATGFDISSTRLSTVPQGQDVQNDTNSIKIEGTLASYDLSSPKFQLNQNSKKKKQVLMDRYNNAAVDESSEEYQNLINQYNQDLSDQQNNTYPNAYADESVLWNLKKNYEGNVLLDATVVYDEEGNEVTGATASPIILTGSYKKTDTSPVIAISAMGNVDIKGNVIINGDIRATKDVTICGNVIVNGNIIANGKVSITNGATINGDITASANIELGVNEAEERVQINGNMQTPTNITAIGNISISGIMSADSIYLINLEDASLEIKSISGNGNGFITFAHVISNFEYRDFSIPGGGVVTVSGDDIENTQSVTIAGPADIKVKSHKKKGLQFKEEALSIGGIPDTNANVEVMPLSVTTYKNVLDPKYTEAETKYDLSIADYTAQLRPIDLSKISSHKLVIDNRNDEKAVRFYKLPANYNLSELKLDSYGDTYIVIPKNLKLQLSEITSDVYFSNLFFILEDNATLVLNKENAETAMNIHVISKNRDNGSKLIIGDKTSITGSLDVDKIELGNGVVFNSQQANDISGALKSGYSKWMVTQYIREDN